MRMYECMCICECVIHQCAFILLNYIDRHGMIDPHSAECMCICMYVICVSVLIPLRYIDAHSYSEHEHERECEREREREWVRFTD